MALRWVQVSPYCLDAGSHTVARVSVLVDGRQKWRYESHRRELDPKAKDGYDHTRSVRLGMFDDSQSARAVCNVDAAAMAARGKRGEESSGPDRARGSE